MKGSPAHKTGRGAVLSRLSRCLSNCDRNEGALACRGMQQWLCLTRAGWLTYHFSLSHTYKGPVMRGLKGKQKSDWPGEKKSERVALNPDAAERASRLKYAHSYEVKNRSKQKERGGGQEYLRGFWICFPFKMSWLDAGGELDNAWWQQNTRGGEKRVRAGFVCVHLSPVSPSPETRRCIGLDLLVESLWNTRVCVCVRELRGWWISPLTLIIQPKTRSKF